MVEVKLVQGKTQTVKTVLPVTVREARREQLAEAINFVESDLAPFLGTGQVEEEEEEEEETTWFFFFPPPVEFRLDIVRVVDELDSEIYNNSKIIEETEEFEETEVLKPDVEQ